MGYHSSLGGLISCQFRNTDSWCPEVIHLPIRPSGISVVNRISRTSLSHLVCGAVTFSHKRDEEETIYIFPVIHVCLRATPSGKGLQDIFIVVELKSSPTRIKRWIQKAAFDWNTRLPICSERFLEVVCIARSLVVPVRAPTYPASLTPLGSGRLDDIMAAQTLEPKGSPCLLLSTAPASTFRA